MIKKIKYNIIIVNYVTADMRTYIFCLAKHANCYNLFTMLYEHFFIFFQMMKPILFVTIVANICFTTEVRL